MNDIENNSLRDSGEDVARGGTTGAGATGMAGEEEYPTIVAGSAATMLAADVAAALGVTTVPVTSARFPDGEAHVKLEGSVRGRRLYLLQSLEAPIGEHLIELALIADAARRAGATSITAVIPYLGYARQDRRAAEGTPIGAAVIAKLLASCGLERIVTVDLHSTPVEGFFSCPVDNLTAEPLLAEAARLYLDAPDRSQLGGVQEEDDDVDRGAGQGGDGDGGGNSGGVVVAPDLGAAKLARRYARHLGVPMAVVHKVRLEARSVVVEQLVGEVRGRTAVVVDDMISTGATIAAAIDAVVAAGASPEVVVAATHGVFAPGSEEILSASDIRAILVTDSLEARSSDLPPTVRRVSLAPLLADAISRLHQGRSLAELLAKS